jgi:uncharacterized membrane protein/plastocyanin
MTTLLGEWLHLLVRWMHVIAAIMWIGSSIFFNWLDRHIAASESPKPGVEGELWMVHSGGFYQVEKKLVAPEKLPKTLHWFKWEAAFTWISGFFLLWLVYYMGGGIYLVDPATSPVSPRAALAIGLSLLVLAWLVYDALWTSALAETRPALATVISVALGIAAVFALTHVMSGRAAYIHVGAMLGTLMAGNVWVRIIPAQKHLVAATAAGRAPEASFARKAKERSRHNNYMTYPVVFIMISNHFPQTFGERWSWLILIALALVGAGIRHYQNTGERSPRVLLGAVGAAAVLAAAVALFPGASGGNGAAKAGGAEGLAADLPAPRDPTRGGPPAAAAAAEGVDPASAGAIVGTALFQGTPPEPEEVSIPPECGGHGGPRRSEALLVANGRVANVFVWISRGIDWKGGAPREPAVLDQKGCVYEPHVLGCQVGQPVRFVNSDQVLHNVHTIGKANGSFNLGIPAKAFDVRAFAAPEIMVHTLCDVHPWMSGYVGVVAHPYFAVTGADGAFALENVPPGAYVLEAWHETLGRKKAEVKVEAKETAKVEFAFEAAGR